VRSVSHSEGAEGKVRPSVGRRRGHPTWRDTFWGRRDTRAGRRGLAIVYWQRTEGCAEQKAPTLHDLRRCTQRRGRQGDTSARRNGEVNQWAALALALAAVGLSGKESRGL
jgi:hypothetical protein